MNLLFLTVRHINKNNTLYKNKYWKIIFLDVQERQMSTKTQNKKEMNEASKKFFLNGPLKYEKKLYDFARKVFNERLKFFKVKLPENSKR